MRFLIRQILWHRKIRIYTYTVGKYFGWKYEVIKLLLADCKNQRLPIQPKKGPTREIYSLSELKWSGPHFRLINHLGCQRTNCRAVPYVTKPLYMHSNSLWQLIVRGPCVYLLQTRDNGTWNNPRFEGDDEVFLCDWKFCPIWPMSTCICLNYRVWCYVVSFIRGIMGNNMHKIHTTILLSKVHLILCHASYFSIDIPA